MQPTRKPFRLAPVRADVLAGLTTAFALVPECIAFALVAHLNPLMGLYGAFIICTLTALFGGRPGMVSGAAGSMAVVIVALVVQHGVQYLLATVLLGGLVMLLFGLLRLGKLVRLVPYPVMLGFVNGLAIVIALAQLEHFKSGQAWLAGNALYLMLGLVALTMAIVYVLPRLTRAVPPALVAILGVGLLVYLFDLPTRTLGDMAHIAGGLPGLALPEVPWTLDTLRIIAPYAVLMAMVGLLETLLTLNLTDEITESRGHPDRECVALGAANMVSGLCGGMGGCAMIGQSLINISSGARARLSGIVASVMLLVFIMFGAEYIEKMPIAALTGLMIMVAIGTFEWASIRAIGRMPTRDNLVGFLVAGITVLLHNLALAVLIGVIISALVFAWENAKRIRARKYVDEDGTKHYEIYGPLFFGSVQAFSEKFDIAADPDLSLIHI